MKRLWRYLVGFGFRLLYNELAWLYDPVSWLVSFGQWRQWQQTALGYLPPPPARVLEVAPGPGHLLADLAAAGYQATGLDPSRAMLRQARRRAAAAATGATAGQGQVGLCRGQAQRLPFAAATFAAVVVTFPTRFIYDPAWLEGLVRVLAPGGRLVVVETATLGARDHQGPGRRGCQLAATSLECLYRATGQRGPAPDLPALLQDAGLIAWRERIDVGNSTANLVVADLPAGPDRSPG